MKIITDGVGAHTYQFTLFENGQRPAPGRRNCVLGIVRYKRGEVHTRVDTADVLSSRTVKRLGRKFLGSNITCKHVEFHGMLIECDVAINAENKAAFLAAVAIHAKIPTP